MTAISEFSFNQNIFCENRQDRKENIFLQKLILEFGGNNVQKKTLTRHESGQLRIVKIVYKQSDFEDKTRAELQVLASDIQCLFTEAVRFNPSVNEESHKIGQANNKREALRDLKALSKYVNALVAKAPIPSAEEYKICKMPAKRLLAGAVLATAIGAALVAVGILFLAGTVAAPIVLGVAGFSLLLGLGLGAASIFAFVKNHKAKSVA